MLALLFKKGTPIYNFAIQITLNYRFYANR